MTDTTARPEVDDPRVLALAKARQQLAYENPFNAVCPSWDGLSEQEQRLSLLDARSYLHAALKAGLVPAVSAAVVPAADRAAPVKPACRFEEGCHRVVPCDPGCGTPWPATDRAALKTRIAAAVQPLLMDTLPKPIAAVRADEVADAVLAVLPAPADRAAEEMTAEEARTLADDLGLQLYRAQDALAFVEECCVIADREQRPVTTADVREWMKGARCGRQLAAAVPVVGVAADTCAHCGEPVRLITGTLAAWWVHDPDGHTACHPQQADSQRATPGPVVPAQPGNDTKTRAVGYSGKGRLWCLTCPRPDREDVPVTIDVVRVGELCAGCGRDVVEVARATEQQPKEA